jgi:hypothetical protein
VELRAGKPVPFDRSIGDVHRTLAGLLDRLRTHPITTAQECELELHTCAMRIRDLLCECHSVSGETLESLRSLRTTVLELRRRIHLLRDFNAGLVAVQAAQTNGYSPSGRPAGVRA